MLSIVKKHFVSSLLFIILICFFIFYHTVRDENHYQFYVYRDEFMIKKDDKESTQNSVVQTTSTTTTVMPVKQWDEDDISCHNTTEDDALPSAEDAGFTPPDNSIFFHETSCRKWLNSRQACAIESAARTHPERKIYVLFSGPITENILNLTRNSITELKIYPNINFARVHVDEYAKDTPLQNIFTKQLISKSKWKIVHTSDLLRIITMYKFGGMYLDTDIIVAKPMDNLGRNWLAKGSEVEISSGAMNMGSDELGRGFMKKVMEEIGRTYTPKQFLYSGPDALHRVLNTFCNTTKTEEFSSSTCHGIQFYDSELIYPIPYPRYKKLFMRGKLMNRDKPYSYHLWNLLSHNLEVEMDSPVEQLAVLHCPYIFELYGESFGF